MQQNARVVKHCDVNLLMFSIVWVYKINTKFSKFKASHFYINLSDELLSKSQQKINYWKVMTSIKKNDKNTNVTKCIYYIVFR